MKSNNVKFKGRLCTYFSFTVDTDYCTDFYRHPGLYERHHIRCCHFSVYCCLFLIILLSYIHNKPLLVQEMVNFATQYATVQKQLLYEFEVPYALIDYNGKILWLNEQFMELTGKDKNIISLSRLFFRC